MKPVCEWKPTWFRRASLVVLAVPAFIASAVVLISKELVPDFIDAVREAWEGR